MVSLPKAVFVAAGCVAVAAVGASLIAAALEDPEKTRARRLERRRRRAAENLSREKLLLIFTDISAAVNNIMNKLFQLEQRVRQQAKASGQELAEMEVRQALLQQFCQAMQESDAQVYASHKTTEAEVRKATSKYANDEAVKVHVEKIRKVFKVLSGEDDEPVEVPAHVTTEKVLEMMEKICTSTCELLDKCVADIKREFNITEDRAIGAAMQANPLIGAKFQEFHQAGNVARKAVHAEYGVEDDRILHQFMKEHQADQEFMSQVMVIGQQQHAKMAALGLA